MNPIKIIEKSRKNYSLYPIDTTCVEFRITPDFLDCFNPLILIKYSKVFRGTMQDCLNTFHTYGQSVYGAITSPWSTVSNLASRMTITKPAFTREAGFWSSPSDEKFKSIFGALTDINSQRENWYSVTPYIAEFLCTISNIGFIYVGLKHQSPELIFAGVASAISHSIPKQWLLTVDKIGVLLVVSKLIRERQVIVNHPGLILPVALACIINFSDAYLARQHSQTWPHVVWHLSSAFMANIFLNYANQ